MDMHDLHDLAGSVIGTIPREQAIDIETEAQRDACRQDVEAWVAEWVDAVEVLGKIAKACATERDPAVIGRQVAELVAQEWRRVAVHKVRGRE